MRGLMLLFVVVWLFANSFLVPQLFPRSVFVDHFDTLLVTTVVVLAISFLFSEARWEASILWFFIFVMAIPFSPEVTGGVLMGWLLGTCRKRIFLKGEEEVQ